MEDKKVEWQTKTDRELIKWQKRDDGKESLHLEIGIDIVYDNPVGMTPVLRKEVNDVISGLLRDLTNAKHRAAGYDQIQVSLEQVEGRPYKAMQTLVGEEVPGVPWTAGEIPKELKEK